jgi:hypothetical protein
MKAKTMMDEKRKNTGGVEPESASWDERLIALAQSGDVEGFVEAMLAHPVHGPLMRAFALEEAAPEYEATMKRIRDTFGVPALVGRDRD